MKLSHVASLTLLVAAGLSLSGCSFVAELANTNGEISDSLPPKTIELDNPAESISNNPRPRIVIGGIKEGDTIAIYTDANCSEQSKVASTVATGDPATIEITTDLSEEKTYQFYSSKVSKTGVSSTCSTTSTNYVLDLTAPNAAASLSWQESSPALTLPVHPNWNVSDSADLGSQKLQYYSDSTCTQTVGNEASVSLSAQTANFSPQSDGTFTFKVISIDKAGNRALSACSPALTTAANPPQILSVTLPANKTYGYYDALVFKVNYDTNVTAGTQTRIPLTIGSTTVYAKYSVNCTTATSICFVAVLENDDDIDLDGITMASSIDLNSETIQSTSTSASAQTTFPSLTTSGILVNTEPRAMISTLDTIIREGDGSFTFDITLSRAWHLPVTVPYRVMGTADSSDHNLVSGSVVFSPGQTTKSVSFNIVSDGVAEIEKNINIYLNKPTNAMLHYRADLNLILKDAGTNLTVIHADASVDHVCAVTSNNVAKCWGKNDYAQILNPSSTTPVLTPTQIATSVKQVGVGEFHTCILKTNDEVFCVGRNNLGQIGDGTTVSKTVFPATPALTNVAKLEVSGSVVCAITKAPDNDLYCWGSNVYKQTPTTADSPAKTPVAVITATDVLDVSTDGSSVCAVLTGGELQCWGRNNSGQSGNGATTPSFLTAPYQVFASGVQSVKVSNAAVCAVMILNNELKCWGSNGGYYSRIGVGSNSTNVLPPSTVIASGVQSAMVTIESACAIKTDNSLWCWGHNWYEAIYANEPNENVSTPIDTKIRDAKTLAFTSIGSAGYPLLCYITTSDQLKCWARNSQGQSGQGVLSLVLSPFDTGLTAEKIFMGSTTACTLNSVGSLSCWGGQTGDSNVLAKAYPIDNLLTNISKIIPGSGYRYAISNDNKLYGWGNFWYGTLGDGYRESSRIPSYMSTKTIVDASAGTAHSCFIYSGGELRCSGDNWGGKTGTGPTIDGEIQVFASGMSKVAAAYISSCGVKTTDGTVWCWGKGTYGLLGNAATADSATPVQVSGLTNVEEISGQNEHFCARKSDGSAWCWGNGTNGRLGNASTSNSNIPFNVIASGVKKIVTGSSHTCAIVGNNDDLQCWGNNVSGQLGDGTKTTSNIPKTIITGVKDVAAGSSATCVIMSADSSVKCWGENSSGTVPNFELRGFRLVKGLH